jgi:hypothetical protein
MSFTDMKRLRSKYLRISSKDRRDPRGSTTSDFNIVLGSTLQSIQNCKGFTLKHIGIPHLFRTVRSPLTLAVGWNPTLLPSFNIIVTIPVGNYTIATMLVLLKSLIDTQVQLTSANYAVTVAFDAVTDRLSFASSGSSNATIGFSPQDSDTNELFGISQIQDLKGFISPHILSNAPNLFGHKDILITSRVLSDGSGTIESSDRFISSIAHIPVDVQYGEYIIFRPQVSELHSTVFSASKNISQIDLQVRDDDGEILDLQGGNWEMSLKLYY